MLQRAAALFAVVGIIVAATGCGNDDDGDQPTATAEAPSSSPTPDRRSSIPIIGEVTDAVTSGDPAQLEALFAYQSIPCTTNPPGGAGGPPICKETEADGTPVDVVFSATCEGNYVRKDELHTTTVVSSAVRTDSELYAAYEYSGRYAGGELGYGSDARYFVLFSLPNANPGGGTGYGVVTSDDGVLGIHYGCAWTAQQFADFNEFGTAVVKPR